MTTSRETYELGVPLATADFRAAAKYRTLLERLVPTGASTARKGRRTDQPQRKFSCGYVRQNVDVTLPREVKSLLSEWFTERSR